MGLFLFQDERAASRLHPLLLIGLWVVVFLEIHPFQDGNGRLSRVLTMLLLLQAGYAYVPYSSLTGSNRNTLKQHFRALVERGYLDQQGSGRGVWYELR